MGGQPSIRGWNSCPVFGFEAKGGFDGAGGFVISSGAGIEGSHGWFQKSFQVSDGKWYRFYALRKAEGIAVPRKSVYARVVWQDNKGKPVKSDPPEGEAAGPIPTAEPEYPTDSPAKWPGMSSR